MEEYSEAKIYKSKPDYFFSSAEIFKSVASCTEYLNIYVTKFSRYFFSALSVCVQMLADICASRLGYPFILKITSKSKMKF